MIKPGQEIQQTVSSIEQEILAFLQDPPVSNATHLTQDVVLDHSGNAAFREITTPCPLDSDVCYREVSERPLAFGLTHGLVAKWFDLDAQEVLLSDQTICNPSPENPYIERNFDAVMDAVPNAETTVRIPTRLGKDGHDGHMVHTYEFFNDQPPQFEVIAYPGTPTLLHNQVAELGPQVSAYLRNAEDFKAKVAEVASSKTLLPIIETMAAMVIKENIRVRDAIINYYLEKPASELISEHQHHSGERKLDTLDLAQEARYRIATYLHWLRKYKPGDQSAAADQ